MLSLKKHEILAAFLPGCLASLKILHILANLICLLVLWQIMKTLKCLLASAFIMKSSPPFVRGHLNQAVVAEFMH